MEELLALSFKERGGLFIQKEVEECVPYFVRGIGGRSVIRDHREEKDVPCYATSALFPSLHPKGR